ncbi:hypothetical protein [Bacillus sp. CGMCC 1.16541]|nr:hypothetical protein [Bacillus sp. CGMCC 1.16541]
MKERDINDEGLATEILNGTAIFPIAEVNDEGENPELEVMRSREKDEKRV